MVRKENMAFDTDGNKLPYEPEEVHKKALELLHQGDLVMVVSKIGDDLAVNIMGPPSRATYAILEQALEGYRNVLEAQGL